MKVTTGNIMECGVNRSLLSLILNQNGGIIDDCIVT